MPGKHDRPMTHLYKDQTTMLSIFASELTTQQTELEALLEKAASLRDGIKALKNQQVKVVKIVENLKALLTELPQNVVTELKTEIFNLFPSDSEPAKETAPAPTTEIFTNFVTEVPETEVTTPEIAKTEVVSDRWNPAHFGDLEFNADDNGQLNLLKVATSEPPEPDDYPNLQDFEAAWEAWEKKEASVCPLPAASEKLIDLSGENWEELKAALKPVRQPKQFLIVKGEPAPVEEEAIDDDNWPEVEPVTPVVEQPKVELTTAATDNDYVKTEFLNHTVCYIKKFNGEILAGYIGCSTKKLAQEWADLAKLWGCEAEARKAQRMDAKWECKLTKVSIEQLETIARNHQHLYDGVPAGNAEYTKKSTTGHAETSENLSDSKMLQPSAELRTSASSVEPSKPQSNLPKENSEITKEQKANEDAEIILKGEQAKADILPNYSQPNQQKVFAGDLIRVKSNCHHKSVIGLTGVVTVASQAGCIAKFEDIGNRWLTNDQIEIVKESKLVG